MLSGCRRGDTGPVGDFRCRERIIDLPDDLVNTFKWSSLINPFLNHDLVHVTLFGPSIRLHFEGW